MLDRGYVLRDADGTPRRMIGSMLNLTERRAAERERDRFFSLSADMFCIASFTGHFVRVNPAFCTVLGYEPDELMGMPVLELDSSGRSLRPPSRARARWRQATSRSVTRTGSAARTAATSGWAGRSSPPARSRVSSTRVARDITEQKRAEERLRASEEWYRLLFDANPLPMWVYDIETLAFVAVNDAAVKHYGYSRSRIPRHAHHGHPTGRRSRRRCSPRRVHRIRRSSTVACGSTERRTGGSISVEVVTHALTVLDRPARLTLAHDVTERHRAERALRETNDTLQTLIQASPLAIVTTDLSGTVSEWNVAAERMFGWFAGDVLGRPIPIVPVEQLEDDMRRLSVSGEHSFTGYETRCARKDGTLVDVYVSTAALRGIGRRARAPCGSWRMSPSAR